MSAYQTAQHKSARARLSRYGPKAGGVIEAVSSTCSVVPSISPAEVKMWMAPGNLVPRTGKSRDIHEAFQKESRYWEEIGLSTSQDNPPASGCGVPLSFVFLFYISHEYLQKH